MIERKNKLGLNYVKYRPTRSSKILLNLLFVLKENARSAPMLILEYKRVKKHWKMRISS